MVIFMVINDDECWKNLWWLMMKFMTLMMGKLVISGSYTLVDELESL